jgi:TrmH family RNA methyltransferase
MLSKNEIKLITSLGQKKYRESAGLFVAEGEKLCKDLMNSTLRLYAAYSTKEDIGFETILQETMDRISRTSSSTSHLAIFYIPIQKMLHSIPIAHELILGLDDVQDPGNLGTILRTACWFGITHVVCSPGCADCYNPKVVQSSMGAISQVNVYYTDLSKYLQENSIFPRYGTFLEGECLFETELSTNGIVVLGNEGQGISPAVANNINKKLFIPSFVRNDMSTQFSGVESLNVASATAIICSEFKRRHKL